MEILLAAYLTEKVCLITSRRSMNEGVYDGRWRRGVAGWGVRGGGAGQKGNNVTNQE